MDRFAVRYDAIGEAWESVKHATELVRERLADLDGSLGPLRAQWTGAAAESFELARAEWSQAADSMATDLDEMAELLSLIDENYRSAHDANLAIWDGGGAGASGGPASTVAMSAGSAGGPAGEVDVSIEELRRDARSFYGLQQRLADNMSWISRNLHANAAGMAGADPVLEPWRTLYDDTVRALWAVLGAGTDVLGGMAQGMTDTGNNYVDSEEASTAGHGAALPERLPQLGVDAVRPAAEPPPSGAGAPALALDDWQFEYWPDGYPEKLRYAAGEWEKLSEVLLELSSSGDALINGLVEANTGEVFDRIRDYWASKSQLCGTSEIFPVLTATCNMLSTSCRLLANAVKNAQGGMENLNQTMGDLDIFEVLGYFRNPLSVAAEVGVELGKWLATIAITDKIKTAYDLGRVEAVAALSNGAAINSLRAWANAADLVSVGSERQAYDQVDQGLEQHIGEGVYSGWDGVPGPHPAPASVHIAAAQEKHILTGDATGGGHLSGTGTPGKTEFPPDWKRERILSHATDVARNPDQPPIFDDGRWVVRGTREGVLMRVVLEPDGSVVTAFPEGGPGVHENPRRAR
jgi:WXG100 family type VII secretion target